MQVQNITDNKKLCVKNSSFSSMIMQWLPIKFNV